MYNQDTENKQNCWIAESFQTVSSACSIDKDSWTVYEPVAVDMTHEWALIPNKKCNLGDGEPGSITLDDCAKACKEDCPFFLYHPLSPYNENCWTASTNNDDTIGTKCYDDLLGFFIYKRPERIPGWSLTVNVKCIVGDGEEGVKSVAECAEACDTDCAFFLYHSNSPHAENCWTANKFQSFFRDCSYGNGFVMYERIPPTTPSTTPAITAPATAARPIATKESASVTKSKGTYVCVISTKHKNGVCNEELNTLRVGFIAFACSFL